MGSMVTYADIQAAAIRVKDAAQKTPVMTSRTANRFFQAELFFKCENFQRMGAFKFRGAYNALSQLDADQKARGVLAFSSGNHAQAVALAGSLLGIATTIVMPSDAPAAKIAATRGYGGEVILYDREDANREELTSSLAKERNLTIIPPYDHPDIIAGQGTAAIEFIEEVGELDAIVVPVGGGGLLSGVAIATREMLPNCEVIGVEPEAGDDVLRSFQSGKIETTENPDTIADGARTPGPSELTFTLMRQNVDRIVTVPDAPLIECTRFYAQRMKMIVEPTGCLSLAALLLDRVSAKGRRVGVFVSGGNVDLDFLASLWTANKPTVEWS